LKKIVLAAINSQYIHTNLAVRYLKSYVEKYSDLKIEIYESNINNQISAIIKELYELQPEILIFSTYIWNKEYVEKIVPEIKKILPNIKIVLGGPEVSYDGELALERYPEVDAVLAGEGERILLEFLKNSDTIERKVYTAKLPIENLDEIPFPYTEEELQGKNKILYYESSRGCPFSCSYCLSSIDKGVRYFSVARVKEDLKKFLDNGMTLIKFVDRTFNLRKERYLEIWKFLLENYREGTTFHFEINANTFDEEALEFLKTVPKDFFQFEIGVQSTNEDTMKSILRRNDLKKLSENVRAISRNIHLHLDLIAGLPYENYETFGKSFNYVYDLKPEMIQLGFLKILKGTKIASEIKEYNYKYTSFAPYEILENKFISYGELVKLKNLEKMLDFYYNSEKFKNSVNYIIDNFYTSPFKFFEEIADFYEERGYLKIGHKEVAIFNHLVNFYKEKKFENYNLFIEYLKFDYLLLGKPGFYPEWFESRKDKDKYAGIISEKGFSSIREAYKKTEMERFNFDILENKNQEIDILFNYSKKMCEIEKYVL
jgi:radical SAM superfamily enzyme YgiQ (UPF0313 family)